MEAQQQATDTLLQIERLRRRTRATLRASWFPLVVFGALSVVSAAVVWAEGGPALGVYWSVAGPLGGVAIAVYYRRRESSLGVEGPWVPFALTGAAIIVGCFLAVGLGGALDSDAVAAAGPSLVVSAGYLMFAWLGRSALLAVVATGLAVVSIALATASIDAERLAAILALVYGAVFAATGLAYLWADRART